MEWGTRGVYEIGRDEMEKEMRHDWNEGDRADRSNWDVMEKRKGEGKGQDEKRRWKEDVAEGRGLAMHKMPLWIRLRFIQEALLSVYS